MGETNSNSKPSGLLARIQAMKSEESQQNNSTEIKLDSLDNLNQEEAPLSDLDKQSFNYSEVEETFSDDNFNLGDYTLNQDTDDFTQTDLNTSLPESFVFGTGNDFDLEETLNQPAFATSDNTLPDFDDEMPDFSEESQPDSLNDFNFDEPFTESNDADLSFDEPYAVSNDVDLSFDEPYAESNDVDLTFDEPKTTAASSGLSFTGLYDKETILGDSSGQEEIKRKTKVPVIICIICAIICLIATTLILFIIPSKYNILGKTTKVDENTVIIESTTFTPADKSNIDDEYNKLVEQANVPPAKPNQIVVIEKAEDVIPVPPAVNPKTAKNETYKIKWGDTLWDISNTYYKTPWKYKNIASYNKIPNPDHIISGTEIIIPAE